MTIDKPRLGYAKQVADDLTKDFREPLIDVMEIAERRSGVQVVSADFGKHAEKVAGFCDFSKEQIYVNRDDDLKQSLFTIAHELGHWWLHREFFEEHPEKYPVFPRFQAPNKDDPLEQEANYFAENLLVPEKLLRRVKEAPVSELAKMFCVHTVTMNNRLRDIGG